MARREASPGMTEQQALALLRKYSRTQWPATVGSWTIAGAVMVLLRRLVFDDTWSDALLYGALFASFTIVFGLLLERARARRIPEGADAWTRLEPATVVARTGRDVTVRGRGQTVVAPVHGAWTLAEGDELWVGPSVRPGETMALVRSGAGPFGTPVYAATAPARRA